MLAVTSGDAVISALGERGGVGDSCTDLGGHPHGSVAPAPPAGSRGGRASCGHPAFLGRTMHSGARRQRSARMGLLTNCALQSSWRLACQLLSAGLDPFTSLFRGSSAVEQPAVNRLVVG